MLSDLIIRNFAIIESLHISFAPGFNVLTGETGAGKSIIIDAVNLLLGGRARGDVIRAGAEEATVEAVFDLQGDQPLLDRLDAAGLAEGSELLVRRIVTRHGKNRIFVNGSPVPLTQLKDLARGLVNIYGQHEHQVLQSPEAHLHMLDHFAGLTAEVHAYRDLYAALQRMRKKLESLDLAERERRQRVDMLTFQQQEIRNADLQLGEDDSLERERSLLLHAEKLTAASAGGYATLYADEQAACARIAEAAATLEALQHIDADFGTMAETLREHQYGLEDIADTLRNYADRLDFEPERQQQVEDRLALLAALKRKYAPGVSELLDYLARISAELNDLTDLDSHRDELRQQLEKIKLGLVAAGRDLSDKRQVAADALAQIVERELGELAMGKARFMVHFDRLAEPAPDGLEDAEFYLAANPGEAPQPLVKIASGGELSRIMLALKRSVPEADSAGTLIFDEVDAGIGGEAATAVGGKISRLGTRFQVLCVTHLPQVAAFAQHHYRVNKFERDGRTLTTVTQLSDADRTLEIARMLGGAHAGAQARVHARELIEKSHSVTSSGQGSRLR